MSERGAGSVPRKGGKIRIKTGKETDAKMEAIDTYPVKIIVRMPTVRQNRKAEGNRARSIPPNVPTPLPPLKPEKIVKVCPNTAAKPHMI